jgi:hypothetical protein
MYDHDNTTPTPTKPPNSAPDDTLCVATPAMTATMVAMMKDSASGHARYVLSTTWPMHKTLRFATTVGFVTSNESVSWNILPLSRSRPGRSKAADRVCDTSMLSKRTSKGNTHPRSGG